MLLLFTISKWQPVPDWDGTRDEAFLILIIFGKHFYLAFFMVAFIISFSGLHNCEINHSCVSQSVTMGQLEYT